jgi:hypothetical protein
LNVQKTCNGIPLDTVRGRVRAWIERHAAKLGGNVLEIGSRLHAPEAWWIVNRDLARGEWLGMDMQPGAGVDHVANVETLPAGWVGRFSGVLCSEVLEHVSRPWIAVRGIRCVLREGGWAIFTVPACFPQHDFPGDYYRFTESGLRTILEDAGFVDIETASAGTVTLTLNDHGEAVNSVRATPMHTFAVARAG